MAKINTVLGPINPEDLGITLMHEHILAVNTTMMNTFSSWFDKDYFIQHACRIISNAKKFGVKTIVDQSTIDMDRKIDIIKEVSEKAEINIIVSTGLYNNHIHSMAMLAKEQPDYLTELLVNEFEHGIADTGVKPGWIKCATYANGIDDDNLAILKVIATVHKATHVTIGTHAEGYTGYQQQDVFEAEGVDLSRVLIGHCNDLTDTEYLKKVADRGSTLGMDRFGLHTIQPEEERLSTLIDLCKAGYCDRMGLSHDYIIWCDFVDSIPLHGKVWKDVNWNWLLDQDVQLSYLFRKILPPCKEQGVSEEDINKMLVEVPKRLLTPCC